jgi:sec-independent protein translocase protein TatA
MIGPIGWMELTIILIIALLVVGPKGLPKLGRSIGKALREFKKEAQELKQAVEFEIDEDERKETEAKRRRKQKAKKEPEATAAEQKPDGGEAKAG